MKKIMISFFILLAAAAPLISQNNSSTFRVVLQPAANAKISVNGEKINFRIVKKDNTMAEITFNYKLDTAVFDFTCAGYSAGKFRLQSGKTDYVILNKENSDYRFLSYFKTGIQPKSVTFINNDMVSLPLLDDDHIDVINIKTGERSELSLPPAYAEKKGFVESLVLKKKNELWISQMTTGSAHVFDLTTLKYKKTVDTNAKWSKVLAYNPSMNRVFLTNWESHDISVINPDTYSEEYTIQCFGVPRGIVFSEDNKFAYVCQYYAVVNNKETKGEILKIDLSTNKVVKKFGVPGSQRHMVIIPQKNYLVVSDMGRRTVNIYDLKTDSRIREIAVFNNPNTIAVSPDSNYLYVSCRGPNNPESYLKKGFVMGRIYVIDMNTLKLKEIVEGGNQCTGLDVSPDGRKFVFSDFLDDAIRVYEMK
ncbi:MAG: YncE family protein [Spirochaetes bacterium]|nr:YncE family protein [Spirochaetota bacterium]